MKHPAMLEPDPITASERCQLCERAGVPLTRHHLIPRSQHHKRYVRLAFSRDERLSRIAWLCAACHKYLHAVFEERELAMRLHSVESLRAHPEVRRFADWLGSKPPDFAPRVHTMKRPRLETP